MLRIRLIITIIAFFSCFGFQAAAQTGSASDGLQQNDKPKQKSVYEFKINYPKDRTRLQPDYMDNIEQLRQIEWFIKNVPQLGDSLIIYSYASPEGPFWNNKRLSQGRGETARQYLRSLFTDKSLADSIIIVSPTAENWEGLRELVEADYQRPDKEKVLEIINSDLPSEVKKNRLKKVSYGYAWLHILENYMPQLRYAKWVGKWQSTKKPLEELPAASYTAMIQPVVYNAPEAIAPMKFAPIEDKKTILALKSNLLYDVATVLNFAVEVPFNEKFSLLYEHIFPWWLSSDNKYCLEHLSMGGEFRWWFKPQTSPATEKRIKRDALVGHFLGVYGFGGKGDIQAKRKFGCYQYEFWSAGVTYGYSMPVGKRLNLEFAVSAGYANIPYQHYIPSEDWEILIKDNNKAGTLNYFGLTKAQVNLVIPIQAKTRR